MSVNCINGHAPNSWNRCQRLGRGFDSLDPLQFYDKVPKFYDKVPNLIALLSQSFASFKKTKGQNDEPY